MSTWTQPGIVQVPTFGDALGELTVLEKGIPFPFEIKRVYFLHKIPRGAVRGSHAHKQLRQLIVAATGSFTVCLDDGSKVQRFRLETPREGLVIPPGYWRTLEEFSEGSVALVLASEEYLEDDYIRDYDEFVRWKA